MCLGIPGKVTEIFYAGELRMGKVNFGGITKNACLEHTPDIQVGDYALVHVGFALIKIDEEEANRVFELLNEMEQLEEIKVPQEQGAS